MSILSGLLGGGNSKNKAARDKERAAIAAKRAALESAAAAKNAKAIQDKETKARQAQYAKQTAASNAAATKAAATAQNQFKTLIEANKPEAMPEPRAAPLAPDPSVAVARASLKNKRRGRGLAGFILSPLGARPGGSTLGAGGIG